MPPISTRLKTDINWATDRPEPGPAQARGGPSLPSASPLLSVFLRTPLPNIISPSPDNLRQYYAGGTIPQYRFTPPLPLSAGSSAPSSTPTSSTASAELITSSSTTDTISLVGVSASSFVSLTPTNSVAAAMTGVYISAKNKNSITVTHPATAGGTFDVVVTN